MTFTILQPNDLHRAVDIESDMTFDVAMEAAAMRGRCDGDMDVECQLTVLYSGSSRLCGQISRKSCSLEFILYPGDIWCNVFWT